MNRIDDVIDTVFASSVIGRGFEPLSGQTKDYKIGICCFSAKHARIIKDKEQILFGM
jgi:phosphotransferase system IIA component